MAQASVFMPAPVNNANAQIGFLSLPAELRLQVYDHIDAPFAVTFYRTRSKPSGIAAFNQWSELLRDVHDPSIMPDALRWITPRHDLDTGYWPVRQAISRYKRLPNPSAVGFMLPVSGLLLCTNTLYPAHVRDDLQAVRYAFQKTNKSSHVYAPLHANRQVHGELTHVFWAKSCLNFEFGADLSAPGPLPIWRQLFTDLPYVDIREVAVSFFVREHGSSLRPYINRLLKVMAMIPNLDELMVDVWFEKGICDLHDVLWGTRHALSDPYARRLEKSFIPQLLAPSASEHLARLSLRIVGTGYREFHILADRCGCTENDRERWSVDVGNEYDGNVFAQEWWVCRCNHCV